MVRKISVVTKECAVDKGEGEVWVDGGAFHWSSATQVECYMKLRAGHLLMLSLYECMQIQCGFRIIPRPLDIPSSGPAVYDIDI